MASVRRAAMSGIVPEIQNQPERRGCPRASILAEMGEVVVVELGPQTGLLLDLSTHGMAVQAVYPTSPRTGMNVKFRLPFTGDVVTAACEVAWVDGGRRAGLRFLHLFDDEQKSRLETWLAAHVKERGSIAAVPGAALAAPPASLVEDSAERTKQGTAPVAAARDRVFAKKARAEPEAKLAALERDITAHRLMPLSEMLSRVVELACLLTSASGAAIVLREEQGAFCRASTGDAPDVGSRLKPGSTLTAECLRTGQVVVAEDTERDPRVRPSTAKGLKARSMLMAPIEAHGVIAGVMQVFSAQPGSFRETQTASLQRVAKIIGSLLPEPRAEPQAPAIAPNAESISVPSDTSTMPGTEPPTTRVQFAPGAQAAVAAGIRRQSSSSKTRRRRITAAVAVLVATAIIFVVKFSSKNEEQPSPAPAQQPRMQQVEKPPVPQPDRQEKGTAESAVKPHAAGSTLAEKALREGEEARLPEVVVIKNAVEKRLPQVESLVKRTSPEPVVPPPVSVSNVADRTSTTASVIDVPASAPVLSPPEGRVRVSEGVITGGAISRPLPVYPEAARRSGVQGSVILRVLVATDGSVKRLRVVSGNSQLANAAMEAVRRWRYDITYLNRMPVEVETIEEMKFSPGANAEVSAPLYGPPGLVKGRVLRQPMPDYPQSALMSGVQGSVILRGLIATDGTLKDLRVVSGNPLLSRAALDAVKRWRYGISYVNGAPAEVEKIVQVNFHASP